MLHEGTLFCYLTAEDSVTVDVLNLHGYTVTPMVDKFRGKRFVLQLSHEVRLLIIVMHEIELLSIHTQKHAF